MHRLNLLPHAPSVHTQPVVKLYLQILLKIKTGYPVRQVP